MSYLVILVAGSISLGLILGHFTIEYGNIDAINIIDNMWKDYEQEPSLLIPEIFVKGLLYVIAHLIKFGWVIAFELYPFSLPIAVVLTIVTVMPLTFWIYPPAFFYVIYDERIKKSSQSKLYQDKEI